jgi:hypothetical protein
MKNILDKIGIGWGTVAALALAASSCTGDFEYFNTDPNAAQQVDPTTLITSMELDAMYPTTGETTVPVNRYQTGWNLLADHFAGYMACANHWEGGINPLVYNLTNSWRNTVFEVAFTQVMPAWLQLKAAFDQGLVSGEIMAVGDILKVVTLHRASDMYGPLPVLRFGESRNPYDAQDVLYDHFFATLDNSISTLEEFLATTPDSKSLVKVDAVYGGDFSKWLKFANSLKLRLAMRIRYVDPTRAAQYAQEAIDGGVITATSDNAYLASYRQISVNNPLEMMWGSYNDARMSASMDSFLNGYEDPRRAAMFQPSPLDGQFHGVRNGLGSTEQKFYTNMSAPNIYGETPMRWLLASEVAFLKAEYYLTKGQSADAKSLYEEGIRLSFVENGLSASEAAAYAASDKRPGRFNDSSENPTKYSTNALSSVTVKWADDGNELERIITQKWIALFPNGMEAWAEFRRTGFPRIFPILENSNDPSINKNTQIRRVIFPKSEYSNNAGAVNAAARLLKGGADTGGARLWWDAK